MSNAKSNPQPKSATEPVVEVSLLTGAVIFGLTFIGITVVVIIACLVVSAIREKNREKLLDTTVQTVADHSIPIKQELDKNEVPSNVKMVDPGEFEINTIYRSTGSSNLTPSNPTLATMGPMADASDERHSTEEKQPRRRASTSELPTDKEELEPKPKSMAIVPENQQLVRSKRPSVEKKPSRTTASDRNLEKGGLDPKTAHPVDPSQVASLSHSLEKKPSRARKTSSDKKLPRATTSERNHAKGGLEPSQVPVPHPVDPRPVASPHHSSKRKPSRTKATTSDRNLETGGLDRTTAPPVVPLPVDPDAVTSLTHSTKKGKHQRSSRKGDDVVRRKRRSKSRHRKSPRSLMSEQQPLQQNEVTRDGVDITRDTGPVVPGAGLEPRETGELPDSPWVKRSSSSRRPRSKRAVSENIPSESVEVEGRTRRKRKSSRHKATTEDDGVRGRGHRVVRTQRSPIERSHDTEPHSSHRTSADTAVERKEKVKDQTLVDGSTLEPSALKDGSTLREVSGVDVTKIVDANCRETDSEKLRRNQDHTPKSDPEGSGKSASCFQTAHRSATVESCDHGLHVQSFLRPDPGPDSECEGGTIDCKSDSFTCSSTPSCSMSTELTSTHSMFQPVPACTQLNHQSPNATPFPAISCSTVLSRTASQMSMARGSICPPSPCAISSLVGETQMLIPSVCNLDVETAEVATGSNPDTTTDQNMVCTSATSSSPLLPRTSSQMSMARGSVCPYPLPLNPSLAEETQILSLPDNYLDEETCEGANG